MNETNKCNRDAYIKKRERRNRSPERTKLIQLRWKREDINRPISRR